MESNIQHEVLFHKNESGGSIENERWLLWLDGVVWVHAHGITQLDAEQLDYQNIKMR